MGVVKDVSRETSEKLAAFESLLCRWSKAINLVSRGDQNSLRERHIADSLQVAEYGTAARTWCDLGSGGGLPGIVVSIARPDLGVTLVESDQRKATFLRTAARELELNCQVLCERSEMATPQKADVVSARALAPLDRLIGLAERHGRRDSSFVFPKGAAYLSEIAAARQEWRFGVDVHPSKTDKSAVILILENIERV